MIKKIHYIIMLSMIGFFALILVNTNSNPVRETFTYFPPDPNTTFESSQTSLSILTQEDEDEYTLSLKTESNLSETAYLRQDITLLYEEGRLLETMSKWEENAKKLTNRKKVKSEDSGHYEAISYHYGEIHYPNDVIKSAQAMSYDQLYVIDSPMTPLESFTVPTSSEEEEWKKLLDHATSQQAQIVFKLLLDQFQVNPSDYYIIPLTKLHNYQDSPLPGLTKAQSVDAIGGIWEGLYKYYFLGIQPEEGEFETPIGSTIPYILLHKESPYLLVLYQTKSGKNVQLIQYLNKPIIREPDKN
ncbi:hypothetical protein [Alkalihalobacillus sp. CinArs1]|uniref:hypothetical protein n=1 Tax=Alkalihalobacillus sp. CinArs1 TaxID=2995314 RepID=UPI0022DD1F23|nr:hypothetical protein [Alkalihalobacillus sp. CinArs1]